MEDSLRMVALDGSGNIDIDRLVSPMSASQRGSSDVIIKAIKDMEADGTSVVNTDALIQKAVSMGLAQDKAEAVIQKLLVEGILYSPTEGKVGRVKS